jgi:hypothetical protein
MKIRTYHFFTTVDHGYLLAKPEELAAVLPVDPETQIPRISETLSLTQEPIIDGRGNGWILLEEDCQAPEFIELLADAIGVFPHQIRRRIRHHETNLTFQELVAHIETWTTLNLP